MQIPFILKASLSFTLVGHSWHIFNYIIHSVLSFLQWKQHFQNEPFFMNMHCIVMICYGKPGQYTNHFILQWSIYVSVFPQQNMSCLRALQQSKAFVLANRYTEKLSGRSGLSRSLDILKAFCTCNVVW